MDKIVYRKMMAKIKMCAILRMKRRCRRRLLGFKGRVDALKKLRRSKTKKKVLMAIKRIRRKLIVRKRWAEEKFNWKDHLWLRKI